MSVLHFQDAQITSGKNRLSARQNMGVKVDFTFAHRWPGYIRGNNWNETKVNILKWALAHPACTSCDSLEDVESYLLRPRREGFPIYEKDSDSMGYSYHSWAPRFLLRVFRVTSKPEGKKAQSMATNVWFSVASFSPVRSTDPYGENVHTGALATALDVLLGDVAMISLGYGKRVLTKTLEARSIIPVPVDQLLLIKVEVTDASLDKIILTGNAYSPEGVLVYTAIGVFAVRPTIDSMPQAMQQGEEAWIDSPVKFPIKNWVTPPKAFQQALDITLNKLRFRILHPERGDLNRWDFEKCGRMNMSSFYIEKGQPVIAFVYFSLYSMGPPPAFVHGGASFTAIDEIIRRTVELECEGEGGCREYMCNSLVVQYKRPVYLETTTIIFVRVTDKKPGYVSLEAEMFAAEEPVPNNVGWEKIALQTSHIATAVYKKDTKVNISQL